MDNIFNLIVNNGLGVASFGLLVYLTIKYMDKIVTTLAEIVKCLNDITETQKNLKNELEELNKRVERLENRKEKK